MSDWLIEELLGKDDYQPLPGEYDEPEPKALGGPGSGNFGHAGRPGQVGGSTVGSSKGVFELGVIDSYGEVKVVRASDSKQLHEITHYRNFGHFTHPTQKFRFDEGKIHWVDHPSPDDFFKVDSHYASRYGDVNHVVYEGWESGYHPMSQQTVERYRAPKAPRRRHRTLGGPGSGNFGHAGRPGEVGGSAPGDGPTHGRRFDSEEGYKWHEEGTVAEWGRNLSKQDRIELTGYSGFGYVNVNNTLRGDPPTKLVTVRKATEEEIVQYRDRLLKGEEIEVADGTLRMNGFSLVVQDRPVDEEQLARVMKSVDQLNECIRERGIVLEEDIEVSRYAYFPRVLSSSLADQVGTTRIEDGFTSTMLGNAGGRLEMGPAAAKAESIYGRTSRLDGMNTEVGSAVVFSIIIPKGTKVASVEAARRTNYDGEGRDDDLTQKGTRVESEILIGSGARFRVQAVEPGPVSKYSGYSVPTTRITMTYIGGGSSEGRS